MEHIHGCITNTSGLQVPCLVNITNKSYQHKGTWAEYPKERGLDLEKVRESRWEKFPPRQLSVFLQEWLFFALLRAILPAEIDLNANDFVRTDEAGNRFISTSKLDIYLRSWEEIHSKLPDKEKLAEAARRVKILNEASGYSCTLISLPQVPPSISLFPPMPLECALSCAMLGQALSVAHNTLLFGHPWESVSAEGFESVRFSKVWGTSELLAEEMERQGWCPFLAEGAESSHDMSTLYYLTTLDGPKPRRDHSGCTEQQCLLTLNASAQHAAACDEKCIMLAPSVAKIAEAIRVKSTPILNYLPAINDAPAEVTVSTTDGSKPYVAISHVWCDGLGNPKGNEIHICQAKRLQSAVDRLFREKDASTSADTMDYASGNAWWLDTLCVPQGSDYVDEKGKAIVQMKDIYERAEAVLVIDSGLCMCDDNTTTLEILARFRLSNWIRRLWTFQEAYFAPSLYLLVGSTPRSWLSLVNAADRLPITDYQLHVAWDLFNRSFNLLVGPNPNVKGGLIVNAPYPDPNACSHSASSTSAWATNTTVIDTGTPLLLPPAGQPVTEHLVATVIQELTSRTASFVSDEPQCLSLLLGLDTSVVVAAVRAELGPFSSRIPSEAGMISVLSLADAAARRHNCRPRGCFPPGIIFPPGRRIRKPGFRWAPQSFLVGSRAAVRHTWSTGLPLEFKLSSGTVVQRPSGMLCERGRGLRVMFPGLLLTGIDSVRPVDPFFIIDTAGAGAPPEVFMPSCWRCTFVEDPDGRAWEGDIAPTSADSGKVAIIINGFSRLDSAIFDTSLVRVLESGPRGEYVVERLGKLAGSTTPEYDSYDWMKEPWKRVEGRWLPLNQMWCVD